MNHNNNQNLITASVVLTENGKPAQKEVSALTEEDLLETVNTIPMEAYPETYIEIKQVFYLGKMLVWNNVLAHYCFGKGRISFEEFNEYSEFETEKVA